MKDSEVNISFFHQLSHITGTTLKFFLFTRRLQTHIMGRVGNRAYDVWYWLEIKKLFTLQLQITMEKNIKFMTLWKETSQPRGPTYSINTIIYR